VTHRMTSRWALLLAGAIALAGGVARADYTFDASDFASAVVSYTEGTGVGREFTSEAHKFNNPLSATGRPTVDTSGDGWDIQEDQAPVLPVHPAWLADELVSIGIGGHLTLSFDHRVIDDPLNPYGVDLSVFGNSIQQTASGNLWTNGDPDNTTVTGIASSEGGTVLVSQNGVTWEQLSTTADGFAPTLGRVFDPDNPDATLGDWNDWWGQPTDPTLPLNPSITAADFNGDTVAELCQAYGQSAGGLGLDLSALPETFADADTGHKWIRYVRIEVASDAELVPEIDAVADAAVHALPGDLNLDGVVDFIDAWTMLGSYRDGVATHAWAEGDLTGDGIVDADDAAILLAHYNTADTDAMSVERLAGHFVIPEPVTLATLLCGSFALLRRQRHA
jgi:hypothetical protein